MDDIVRRLEPGFRRPEVRLVLALAAAALYYGFVVAGEIGRSGSILLSAIPPALSLIWFRSRPALSLALAALGVLLLAYFMTNGSFVQNVTQQSAVLVALFGGAMSSRLRDRRAALALAVVSALLVIPFAYSLYGGRDGAASKGTAFALGLIALLAVALVCGAAARQVLDRNRRLDDDLVAVAHREKAAEQDVLVELERNRLAREVHDVVAHSLAVVIAQADGARFAAETKPETVAPALEAISDTARRALGEVRTMLHDLRTSGEGGVVPGADDLTGLVEGVRGLGVEVEEVAYGEAQALTRTAGLALYRVAQEALTNAMRHGDRAEPVGFEIDWGDREVVLVVTNAVPTEAVPASERAGHGVTGMRERAADAGGDCSAGIGSNGRFRVRVALPIEAEPAPAAVAEQPANPLLALFAQAAPQSRA